MRLSDVTGERTIDVVADIVGPVARIAQDEKASALFAPEETPKGMTPRQFFAKRIEESLPSLLKGHKQDLIDIIAAINGVKPEEYAKILNLAVLMKDVIELVTDEEFIGFLALSER